MSHRVSSLADPVLELPAQRRDSASALPQKLGAIAVTTVAAFAIRLALDEPGPLFLAPIVLTGIWFGAIWGAGVGVVATALFVVASAVNPSERDLTLGASAIVRGVLYCGTGYLVGLVADQRSRLATETARQRLVLDELRAIREALRPALVPERHGLAIAVSFEPVEDMVAGIFTWSRRDRYQSRR